MEMKYDVSYKRGEHNEAFSLIESFDFFLSPGGDPRRKHPQHH
jgi:hypothetical protein